jgi:hypothetical protein
MGAAVYGIDRDAQARTFRNYMRVATDADLGAAYQAVRNRGPLTAYVLDSGAHSSDQNSNP